MEVQLEIIIKKNNSESGSICEIVFTTELHRIPNIGENFEYRYNKEISYYGEVIRVETYKDDFKCKEHVYVTIKEFE